MGLKKTPSNNRILEISQHLFIDMELQEFLHHLVTSDIQGKEKKV